MMQHIWENILHHLQYRPEAPMIFSSALFWCLFIVLMPLYAMIKRNRTQMVLFIVAFSLYFYYKSSGWFFLLLVCTSLVDWSLSRLLVKLKSVAAQRWCVALSIITSLSVLVYFKYANFFLWNWNQMVEGNFQPLDIILPVGISFYTFQSISYIVDVYKKKVEPTSRWIDYIFFLSFFPALVAGPIVRADYFLPQLRNNHRPTKAEIYWGFWLIIVGIIKKAVIADYICQYNDLIFAEPTGYTGFESLMGALGYTVQIYCDFSGYSDMAIGIALIMGFRLGINFNFPYKSRNLTDFWRRWHISLSSWLRDYLYIPLGGNRKGTLRTYINNFLTMLIGGLWHGAAWKFVFWGAMHGVGLAVHKACRPVLKRIPDVWPVKAVSWSMTMLYVSLLWVFFRANDWTDAWLIIKNVFTNFQAATIVPFFQARATWAIMVAIIVLTHSIPTRWVTAIGRGFVRSNWVVKLLVFVITVQLVIEFMSAEVMPFIYFQF